jgi:hypothetical protein
VLTRAKINNHQLAMEKIIQISGKISIAKNSMNRSRRGGESTPVGKRSSLWHTPIMKQFINENNKEIATKDSSNLSNR